MKKLLYTLLLVPFALFGQENYSLSFDGVDDYLEIGGLNGFTSTGSHTFIVYEKHESGTFCDAGAGAFIISEPCVYGGLSSQCLHYGYFSDVGNCETGDYIGVDFFADRLFFNQGFNSSEWNMWAFTYNHNTLERKIYRNGNFIVSDTSSGYNGPLDLMIGARGGGDVNLDHFIGNIDDIFVYNYDLSDNEIHNCLTFSPSDSGLVGYWNFNEGSGDTVYDISGNENHGIIHGATYSNDIPEQNCIEGCTDSLAENYNPEAFIDNQTCEYIQGCTEPNAVNYNQLATQNDSTCISQEEYTIDSLNNVVEQATISLSSLQQALDTWNTTIDLSAGWNMFGYGCPSSINVADGLSNHTESIIITKDNSGNVYMPEFGFNGIGDFTPGFGYQIKLTETIEGFSLCDWYVNDIPEDNIVSLQDSLELINSQIGCTDSLACNYDENKLYDDESCTYPDLGYECDGNVISHFSLSFDDYDDRVELPYINIGNQFIISVDVKISDNLDFGEIINIGGNFTLIYDSEKIKVNLGDTGNNSAWHFGDNYLFYETNETDWINILVNYYQDSLSLYYNGLKLVNEYCPGYSIDGLMIVGDRNFNSNASYNFGGNIDNIIIWDSVITEFSSFSDFCDLLSLSNQPVLHWTFEEGNDNLVNDLSGNGNIGQIFGAIFSDDVPQFDCD